MRFTSFISVSSCVALLGTGVFGCGFDGSSANQTPGTADPGSPTSTAQAKGYMVVHSAPTMSQEYKQVNVNVEEVEVMDATGKWHHAGRPHRMINLLALDVEARALLDLRATLDVGIYTKLRLKLGDGCTVVRIDGTVLDLRVPIELRAGLDIDIDLDIRADLEADVYIGVDLSACLQLVVLNGNPCYYLRPLFTAVNKVLTGSISGVVKAKLTGEILANAKVFAQFFDENGRPHIAAVAYADVNGRFKLEGLKLGRKYHVICNPPGFGKAFKIFASAEIDLDVNVSARVLDIDLDVDLDLNLSAMAKIRGDILPGISLDGCDYVALVRKVACGEGCNKWFIMDHTNAKVDANESYEFKGLTNGLYGIQSKRNRCHSGGCSWSSLWLSADIDINLSINLDAILGIRL
jgi:hypothetical protein